MIYRPSLEQLRVLVAVAETGTFTAAARRLGRVQPAITQSVKLLEAGMQIRLFDRKGRTIQLTESGRLLLDTARQALAAIDAFCDQAERLSSDVEAELTVAVDGGMPKQLITQGLVAVAKAFPDLPVAVFSEGIGGAEQLLRDGVVQLAIFFPSTATASGGLAHDRLGSLEVAPMVASTHPLADAPGPLAPEDLADHVQFVMSDRSRLLAPVSGSIMSPRTWVFSEYNTRVECLRAGLGWGHFIEELVAEDLAAGRLKILDIAGEWSRFRHIELNVFHRLGHPPARAGQALIDALKKSLAR